ncbi:hypothetical protein ADUPG1_009871, partial [Aduncisulcus paluster]
MDLDEKDDETYYFVRKSCGPRLSKPVAPSVKLSTGKSSRMTVDMRTKVLFSNEKVTLKDPYQSLFDEFDIDQLVGGGSFAVVYKARWKTDGKVYAVKKTKFPLYSSKQREQLVKEAEAMVVHKSNPHIVHTTRAWIENGHGFVQMEYCSGSVSGLLSYIRRPFKEEMIWLFLADMCVALRDLHSHGYVHTDIKPNNIFIKTIMPSKADKGGLEESLPFQSLFPRLNIDSFVFKLGDFGLATQMEQAEEGDARYASPEALQGSITPEGDMFSLGVSVLELCMDINIPDSGKLFHFIRSDSPFILCDTLNPLGISKELRMITKNLLSHNPKFRP